MGQESKEQKPRGGRKASSRNTKGLGRRSFQQQSKGERNRDHREKEDKRTETPGSFPLQRTQGERAHSNRGGPELQGEWRKKLTAAGRPQGEEERDRGQQEKEKYTSESHEIVQKQSLSRVRGDSSRSSQD